MQCHLSSSLLVIVNIDDSLFPLAGSDFAPEMISTSQYEWFLISRSRKYNHLALCFERFCWLLIAVEV